MAECLNCGRQIKPTEPPDPGDIVVCTRCGAVMIYNHSLKLRGLTEQEMRDVQADPEVMDMLGKKVQGMYFIRHMDN